MKTINQAEKCFEQNRSMGGRGTKEETSPIEKKVHPRINEDKKEYEEDMDNEESDARTTTSHQM